MEEEEMLEHEVVVDKYMTVELKIPKQLTAMDLFSLCTKAQKLFKMSEVPIKETRKYTKKETGLVGQQLSEYEAMIMKLKSEGKKAREIGDKLGKSEATIYNKIHIMRKQGKMK